MYTLLFTFGLLSIFVVFVSGIWWFAVRRNPKRRRLPKGITLVCLVILGIHFTMLQFDRDYGTFVDRESELMDQAQLEAEAEREERARFLQVEIAPVSASLVISNIDTGEQVFSQTTSSERLELPEGFYRYEARAEGYKEKRGEFFRPNRLTLNLELVEDTGPYGDIEARTLCEVAIRDQLVAPSSAKFPGAFSEVRTELMRNSPGGLWNWVTVVDSQNSFGAMIRSQWSCQVYDDGRVEATPFR